MIGTGRLSGSRLLLAAAWSNDAERVRVKERERGGDSEEERTSKPPGHVKETGHIYRALHPVNGTKTYLCFSLE